MDINAANFSYQLPEIVNDISCSSFVAFDLEFTGVPRLLGQGVQDQTLQQRYADNKVAAEKYQILQVGLTICRENTNEATYNIKTYNIHLSPFVDQGLDINRDWLCMSGAIEFLLGNDFSIDTACKEGVRYLSRQEEAQCLQIAAKKYSAEGAQDAIKAESSNEKATAFFDTVRYQINSWLAKAKKSRAHFLNIPAPSHARVNDDFPTTLSNMQQRLVHTLVRAEYPTLRSRSKRTGFVQIEILSPDKDKDKDKDKHAAQLNGARQRIQKHVGFRWIIEALIGGDLTGFDEKSFKCLLDSTESPFTQQDLVDRVKLRLERIRPILVGHNCLLDLMFLYSGFIGSLPDTVEEFQKLIHGLFPMIMDTKYLSTLDGQTNGTRSSLEEINRGLARVTMPIIEIEPSHSKYFYRKSYHEAGYDSMLSAVAFLRLSVQLTKGKVTFTQAAKLDELKIFLANEMPLVKQVSQRMQEDTICVEEPSSSGSEDLIELSDGETMKTYCRPAPFADTGDAEIAVRVVRGLLLPRAGTNFWRLYGNKLRVFGTVEGMMKLDM